MTQEYNLGSITGPKGADVTSIVKTGTDANGGNIYTITFSDGVTQDFTAPKGPKGDDGAGVVLVNGIAPYAINFNSDPQTQIDDKADKTIPTIVGNFAALDATGNIADSGKNITEITSLLARFPEISQPNIADCNTAVKSGIYSTTTATLNTPISAAGGTLFVMMRGVVTQGNQLWFSATNAGSTMDKVFFRNTTQASGWGNWVELTKKLTNEIVRCGSMSQPIGTGTAYTLGLPVMNTSVGTRMRIELAWSGNTSTSANYMADSIEYRGVSLGSLGSNTYIVRAVINTNPTQDGTGRVAQMEATYWNSNTGDVTKKIVRQVTQNDNIWQVNCTRKNTTTTSSTVDYFIVTGNANL